MKKVISLAIVGMFLLEGISALEFKNAASATVSRNLDFMVPLLETERYGEKFLSINLKGVDTYLLENGRPVLPKMVKVVELPFGAKNIRVEVTPQGVKEMSISAPVRPAPAMLPLGLSDRVAINYLERDDAVYSQHEYYPNAWYSYRAGCGLNGAGEHVTLLIINFYPVRYSPADNKIEVARSADVQVKYDSPSRSPFPSYSAYDMVIIAPGKFSGELERLVEHKNSHGISTFLKTTEDIYSEYGGRDEAEKIKYFIKDAIEQWGIKYVMLVGGLKSQFWAKPKDNSNIGSRGWYLPVRYTNLWDNPAFPLDEETIHDPGVISDLYYADIYKEGGAFEDWDPNGDGIFAAWNKPGVENDTYLDLFPDVAVGRLACRSISEVQTVVDKIINYENGGCDPSWFKKMVVISGDGFLDQHDLNITWDTKSLPDGSYTIYAQSMNDEGEEGPVDVIHITLDRSQETDLHFNHDDHLNPALQNGYPAPPIAEIVSVSDGDVLGNTDYFYSPDESEAYLNFFMHWANVSYQDGVLTIRGKSYDPQPYGNLTDIHVWIENGEGDEVFSAWRNNTEMFYEGEWTVGDHAVQGRGGALYYMPDDFKQDVLFASNGRLTGQDDVLEVLNKGSGFVFMSGHGSPNSWGDHYPGVPGNRQYGSITGLVVTQLKPWFPYIGFPVFPIDTLSNGEKLPVAVIGGCHNSQFNVSMVPAFLHAFHLLFSFFPDNSMWTYGQLVPECLSWRLVRNPDGGAIASMGNTGLGYGVPGRDCTTGGGDGWITSEFFRQYGEKGYHVLGDAYIQTQTSYVSTFDMTDLGAGHTKSVQQWVLLGDPSLMIGGYS